MSMFDWIIIRGRSKSSGMAEGQERCSGKSYNDVYRHVFKSKTYRTLRSKAGVSNVTNCNLVTHNGKNVTNKKDMDFMES